ncbi:hypothetical protein [Paraclostridium sordellii]|uniref:hypothetical protein n=1 Tax=Paraclostridium sordellii TaxID=1505 RepID=UPI000C76BA0F|nr:hypothetical protein [Paeniclostridium sordellii]AUN14697.1 hypothetical protein RSJ16_10895 [Paeniclostridium sordellii]MDU5019973.1 hypothetical protein [Clostridiales bacterium]
MNQEKLDAIFNEVTNEMAGKLNNEYIYSRLKEFADENGKISTNNLSIALYLESISYSTKYLHEVLSKVLVEEDK